MKKLFLLLICFCSLGCFAQSDGQKELFSYKFIEENLLPIEEDPPPPKYYGIFFVKSEGNQVWSISDLNTLWCIYAFEYEEKKNKEYSSLTRFLYEVLNFKKLIKKEQIKKYGKGEEIKIFPDIKKDYEELSFNKFKSKYTKKSSDIVYVIKGVYELILTFSFV